MKKAIKHILSALLALVAAAACTETYESLDFSGDVEIRSFSIDGVSGTIDPATASITLMMPMGTNLTALTPIIEVGAGAEVSPKSGEPANFLVERNYTVSHKDIYQTYKVKVSVVKAEILKFSIGSNEGIINAADNTILVYVAPGTNLAALAPIVKYTDGAVLTPDNGSVIDFTHPVKYTLDYLGSRFEYMVTVIAGTPPAQPQVIYNGEDVTPGWWTVGSAGDISSSMPNPRPNAVNSTAACASIWRNGADDPWTGGGLGGLNVDPAVYGKFSIVLLKDCPGNVQMEIQGEGAGNQYLQVYYTDEAVGEWQELVFELPENHNFTKIHTILVAPQIDDTKNDPNFTGHRMYWDQLTAHPW